MPNIDVELYQGTNPCPDLDKTIKDVSDAKGSSESLTARLTSIETSVSEKQNELTVTQLSAVNSGIDSEKVASIATNTQAISDIDSTLNGSSTETPLSSTDTAGIIKDVGGQIDYSGSSVYISKKYDIPQKVNQVRVKTTAYDSDDYYMSEYYVYFANGTTVTGKELSNYPQKTDINTVLTVPTGSNCVWIVSRKKISSGDTSEIDYQNACSSIVSTGGIVPEINDMQSSINQLEETVSNLSSDQDVVQDITLSDGYYVGYVERGDNWTNSLESNDSSQYTASAYHLDSKYINHTLKINVASYGESSGRYFGFCDENNIVVDAYMEREAPWVHNSDGTYTLSLTIVSPYLFLSFSSSTQILSITASYNPLEGRSKVAYVSPSGSDSNDGLSMSSAFETVTKALSVGCDRIILAGGKYYQTIDLSKSYGKHIDIISYDRTSRPVFCDPDYVLADSATLSDGVYSVSISKSIDSDNNWLYLDGVSDASTQISDAERMPQQRGKEYRCDDTKIERCSSNNLSDALAEIKSSSNYKWYVDSNTLYFSSPSAPSSSHPIAISTGKELFLNANRSISVSISGVECKYIALNLKKMSSAKATDCKVSNIFGYGAITYDETIDAQFLRCEAARCCISQNGDGINADVTNNGEPFAKHYSATLIDCWAHDNCDDGYSDHRHAETTVFGGLYEYNGKSGITPAYGSHCSCYNVYSRKNFSGFSCVGDVQVAEGGKYTQLLCMNCVAENNTTGGQLAGFYVEGSNNKIILVGCKAIGNTYSYKIGSADAYATLIDCYTSGQTTIIGGTSANATVETTTLVTSN